MNGPYNPPEGKVAHAIFPGHNDQGSLMLCGYEWGFGAEDEALENDPDRLEEVRLRLATIQTFASKGFVTAYDRRIGKWFSMFGHPLGNQNGLSSFDKSILQTNWADDANPQISDYAKFLSDQNRGNFLYLMRKYRPKVLVLLGINMLSYIQDDRIRSTMIDLFGAETNPCRIDRKTEFAGKRFRVGFQSFESLEIVALPHPTGSIGLSDAYIALFAPDIGKIISDFKADKHI